MSSVDDRCGTLGYKVSQLRMEEGYSFAEYAQIQGISANRLSSLERGKEVRFTADELLRIGRFHGVSMDELLVEERPLPGRFARTVERLRNNMNEDYIHSLHVMGKACAEEAVGIGRDERYGWKTYSRAERLREKGLVKI